MSRVFRFLDCWLYKLSNSGILWWEFFTISLARKPILKIIVSCSSSFWYFYTAPHEQNNDQIDTPFHFLCRRTVAPQIRPIKQRMPVQIRAKVSHLFFVWSWVLFLHRLCSPHHSLCLPPPADAVAYAALLRNELLGAGIETVPDAHTDDRRHAVLSQDSHGLFRVRVYKKIASLCLSYIRWYD